MYSVIIKGTKEKQGIMKEAVMSECRDSQNRSKKFCICGCHNASNPKSNKNHNSTRVKLEIRALRNLVRNIIKASKDYYYV